MFSCSLLRVTFTVGRISKTQSFQMFSKPTVTSTQMEDSALGPPVKGVNLVFLSVISTVCLFVCLVSRLISASVSEGS